VLSATKLAAGIAGHSHALVADAGESFADIFSSLIVWRGLVVAAAPPDEDHPTAMARPNRLPPPSSPHAVGAALWIVARRLAKLMQPHFRQGPFTLIVLVVWWW